MGAVSGFISLEKRSNLMKGIKINHANCRVDELIARLRPHQIPKTSRKPANLSLPVHEIQIHVDLLAQKDRLGVF